MKSVVNGIEVISNEDEIKHKKLCGIVRDIINDVFEFIDEDEINEWIKIIDFTPVIINNDKSIMGNYNLCDKIILIKNESGLRKYMSLYHEVVHSRIYYENREMHNEMIEKYNIAWSTIDEYKTRIITYCKFISEFNNGNYLYSCNDVINLILNELYYEMEWLECFKEMIGNVKNRLEVEKGIKVTANEIVNISYESNNISTWYEVAMIGAWLYILKTFPAYINLSKEELYEFINVFRTNKMIDNLLKINVNCDLSPFEISYDELITVGLV